MTICLCTAFALPCVATAYMSNEDMGFDPDEGDYIPREQFRHSAFDGTTDADVDESNGDADEDVIADIEMEATQEDCDDEPDYPTAEQGVDEATAYATSTKGTHPEFRGKGPQGNLRSLQRGRDVYKDRRLREDGSGKTRARDGGVW